MFQKTKLWSQCENLFSYKKLPQACQVWSCCCWSHRRRVSLRNVSSMMLRCSICVTVIDSGGHLWLLTCNVAQKTTRGIKTVLTWCSSHTSEKQRLLCAFTHRFQDNKWSHRNRNLFEGGLYRSTCSFFVFASDYSHIYLRYLL